MLKSRIFFIIAFILISINCFAIDLTTSFDASVAIKDEKTVNFDNNIQ
jgi:hypothetical protein